MPERLGFGATECGLTTGSGNRSVLPVWATATPDKITIRTTQFKLICSLFPPTSSSEVLRPAFALVNFVAAKMAVQFSIVMVMPT